MLVNVEEKFILGYFRHICSTTILVSFMSLSPISDVAKSTSSEGPECLGVKEFTEEESRVDDVRARVFKKSEETSQEEQRPTLESSSVIQTPPISIPRRDIQRSEIEALQCVAVLEGHSKTPGQERWVGRYVFDQVGGMVFNLIHLPEKNRYISTGRDGLIKQWDLSTSQCSATVSAINGFTEGYIAAITELPDGSFITSEFHKGVGKLKLRERINLQCIKEVPVTANCILSLGRDLLACGYYDISIWDIAKGECIATLFPSFTGASITGLALVKEGMLAAVLSGKCSELTIDLWDISKRELIKTLTKPKSSYASVLTKLTDDILISGSIREIDLFNNHTGECLKTLKGHTDWIDAIAILPNGALVSASQDGTVKFWDPFTGECLRTHQVASINPPLMAGWKSIIVQEDGSLIAGLYDGTIQIWK